MARVNVTQDKDSSIEVSVLAKNIVKMSETLQDLKKSGLNEEALIILLADSTKMAKRDIKKVFEGMAKLKEDYINLDALNKAGN